MSETTFKNTNVELNDTDFSKYAALAADAVCDIKSRAGKQGQFLNWIDFLPNNQLKNIAMKSTQTLPFWALAAPVTQRNLW